MAIALQHFLSGAADVVSFPHMQASYMIVSHWLDWLLVNVSSAGRLLGLFINGI